MASSGPVAAAVDVKLDMVHSPPPDSSRHRAAACDDEAIVAASSKPAAVVVSRFTWLQLGLLSAAWACAFSGLTASVAAMSVASKEVLNQEGLATLPTALVLFMTGLANIFIAWEVQALGGRKWANVIGATIGIASSGLVALALVRRSFLGLCLASAFMGISNAHGQLYRFAAVEFVPASHQASAIAIVLSGGMVGAVVGPEYAKRTRSAIPEHPFVGCFLASMGVYALNLVLILLVRFPSGSFVKPEKGDSLPAASPPPSPPASDEGSTAGKRGDAPAPGVGGDDGDDSDGDGNAAAAAPRGAESARAPRLLNAAAGEDAERAERAAEGQKASSTSGRPMDAPAVPARPRSLFVLVGPPDVHTAISVSAISYGVMCLLMVPVPVAMTSSGGFSFAESALVVQFHMIAMYAPSFFSGQLISRLGAATVQVLGALVIVAGTVVLLLGTSMAHYSVGEVLNGLGWNLLFSGATNTLASAAVARGFSSAERMRAQAANDLCVFVLAGVGSFTSSIVLKRVGWDVIQYASQGACGLLLALLARAWLLQRRAELPALVAAKEQEEAAAVPLCVSHQRATEKS